MRAILLSWLLFCWVKADSIRWHGNYNIALQRAKKEQKDMMVLLIQRGSKVASQTISRNFVNRSYIGELNESYIAVIITYEGKSSYPIELYYSTTFPTLFFISSSDERFIVEPIYGDDIDTIFSSSSSVVPAILFKN